MPRGSPCFLQSFRSASRVSWSNSLVKWTADAGLEETIGICGDLGALTLLWIYIYIYIYMHAIIMIVIIIITYIYIIMLYYIYIYRYNWWWLMGIYIYNNMFYSGFMGDHPQSRGRFVVWPFTHPKVMAESFLGLSQPLSWTFEDVKKVVDAVHILGSSACLSSSGDSSSNPCGVKPNKNTIWLYSVGLFGLSHLSLSLSPSLLICKRKQWGNKYTPKTFFLLFVWQAHGLYQWWNDTSGDQVLKGMDP